MADNDVDSAIEKKSSQTILYVGDSVLIARGPLAGLTGVINGN